MNRICLIIFLFCSQCKILFSQKKEVFFIKSDLLTLVNFERPTVYLSSEFIVKNKIGLEAGYGVRYLNKSFQGPYFPDSSLTKFRGYTAKFEMKIYNVFKEKNSFIGLSYTYIDDRVNAEKHYYKGNGDLYNELDSYVSNKVLNKFHLLLGIKFWENEHFTGEMGFELGVKHRFISYEFNEFDPFTSITSEGTGWWEKPQNKFVPSIALSIKLSYKLI